MAYPCPSLSCLWKIAASLYYSESGFAAPKRATAQMPSSGIGLFRLQLPRTPRQSVFSCDDSE